MGAGRSNRIAPILLESKSGVQSLESEVVKVSSQVDQANEFDSLRSQYKKMASQIAADEKNHHGREIQNIEAFVKVLDKEEKYNLRSLYCIPLMKLGLTINDIPKEIDQSEIYKTESTHFSNFNKYFLGLNGIEDEDKNELVELKNLNVTILSSQQSCANLARKFKSLKEHGQYRSLVALQNDKKNDGWQLINVFKDAKEINEFDKDSKNRLFYKLKMMINRDVSSDGVAYLEENVILFKDILSGIKNAGGSSETKIKLLNILIASFLSQKFIAKMSQIHEFEVIKELEINDYQGCVDKFEFLIEIYKINIAFLKIDSVIESDDSVSHSAHTKRMVAPSGMSDALLKYINSAKKSVKDSGLAELKTIYCSGKFDKNHLGKIELSVVLVYKAAVEPSVATFKAVFDNKKFIESYPSIGMKFKVALGLVCVGLAMLIAGFLALETVGASLVLAIKIVGIIFSGSGLFGAGILYCTKKSISTPFTRSLGVFEPKDNVLNMLKADRRMGRPRTPPSLLCSSLVLEGGREEAVGRAECDKVDSGDVKQIQSPYFLG